MADVATAENEHSSVIMCHGQLMSVEEYPIPQLHAWNGMLVQKVLKFRGEHCRFVELRANEDHVWFESSARLSALTSELLLNTPKFAPAIGVPPYPNLPICAINDASCTAKVGSTTPTSGTCVVCNHVVPLHSMRTHVGRHIFRDECVADAYGFCGSKGCTTELLRNGQDKRVSVILTKCPLEPTNVRWVAMAKVSARNPCAKGLMHCSFCKATVWLYGMQMHFDAKHPDVAPPGSLCTPPSERCPRLDCA